MHDVWVEGWPQHTTIFVRWSATDTLPDGGPYHNHGTHIIQTRWGKIVATDANEDSQAVVTMLNLRAAARLEEAVAAPILS